MNRCDARATSFALGVQAVTAFAAQGAPPEKHGVSFARLAVAGAEHGLADGNPDEVAAAYRKAFDFMKAALSR